MPSEAAFALLCFPSFRIEIPLPVLNPRYQIPRFVEALRMEIVTDPLCSPDPFPQFILEPSSFLQFKANPGFLFKPALHQFVHVITGKWLPANRAGVLSGYYAAVFSDLQQFRFKT